MCFGDQALRGLNQLRCAGCGPSGTEIVYWIVGKDNPANTGPIEEVSFERSSALGLAPWAYKRFPLIPSFSTPT
jgi:hypothetical protein